MKIEAVDFFYLSMPEVRDIGDGSQDALLVRVAAGGLVGWGECEAAPLVSIAAWNCPMSHSACKPVSASVLGQPIDSPDDIRRINALVRANSLDLLQADHTLSGVDVALWDLLGKRLGEPVYRLLGYEHAYPKLAYASVLFGETPELTFAKARTQRQAGYRAVKFGWGPFGRGSVDDDAGQLHATREGLGDDGVLLVDAGTVWGDDIECARQRLPALQACRAQWLEEPFVSGALQSYRQLAGEANGLRLAGGEGCHSLYQAKNMIDYAGLGYIQIDAGRIGGITASPPGGGLRAGQRHPVCEPHVHDPSGLERFPTALRGNRRGQPLRVSGGTVPAGPRFERGALQPDRDGYVHVPEAPGLGVEPNREAIRQYLVETEIRVSGRIVYRTPEI